MARRPSKETLRESIIMRQHLDDMQVSTAHQGRLLHTLDLVQLAGGRGFRVQVKLASIKVSEEAIVVSGTNGEEDLHPAKGRDGADGGNTVGDLRAWKAWGDVEGESEDFRDNISENSQHADTSVLELTDAVGIEGLLVDVGAQAKGIEESGRRLQYTEKRKASK